MSPRLTGRYQQEDICHPCHLMAFAIRRWRAGAHHPSNAALFREVARQEAAVRADAGVDDANPA